MVFCLRLAAIGELALAMASVQSWTSIHNIRRGVSHHGQVFAVGSHPQASLSNGVCSVLDAHPHYTSSLAFAESPVSKRSPETGRQEARSPR